MPSQSRSGPLSRLFRQAFALAAGCLLLTGAAGCRVEGDAHSRHPRAAAHLVPQQGNPPRAAGVALPSDVGAERGPRLDLLSLSRSELWAAWNSLRGDAYELDAVERRIDPAARISCQPETLVTHRGERLRYQGAVQVVPAFRDRLVRFEELVLEVSREVYGRAPSRLRHFGAYSCRSTRRRSTRLSEHALGNAIDVVGFDFARATRDEPLALGAPAALRGPFQIRVARHWDADPKSRNGEVHARFLRELAARLSDRPDVFRGMIGPSRSDHSDHFHFDMSPWRYVYF